MKPLNVERGFKYGFRKEVLGALFDYVNSISQANADYRSQDKKDANDGKDRICVLDFENGALTVDGEERMCLGEIDASWIAHDVATVVMEEVLGNETNVYGRVSATYKSGKFTLAGKLWDGTVVKGTSYPLADGILSPVLVTDKAKNAVSITLFFDETGGAFAIVRENGKVLSVGGVPSAD